MLGSLVFGSGLLLCGTAIGWYLRGAAYAAQNWEILRWNKDVFGFRRLHPGTKIYRGERVMLAVKIDTDELDDDGYIIE